MAYPANRDDKVDWYIAVRRDPTMLNEALEFFLTQHKDAMELATLEGRIMEANKFHPGHAARFGWFAVQTKNLAEYFEYKVKEVRADVMRAWDRNPPTTRKWGVSEIKIMIENEPAVAQMEEIYADVRYVADLWMRFATDFRDRSFRIADAVRLESSNNADAEFERDN